MFVVKWDRSITETWIYLHKMFRMYGALLPPFRVHSHKWSVVKATSTPVQSKDPTSSFSSCLLQAASLLSWGLFIDAKRVCSSSSPFQQTVFYREKSEKKSIGRNAIQMWSEKVLRFSGKKHKRGSHIHSYSIFICALCWSSKYYSCIMWCWSAFNNCASLIKIHFCLLTFKWVSSHIQYVYWNFKFIIFMCLQKKRRAVSLTQLTVLNWIVGQ